VPLSPDNLDKGTGSDSSAPAGENVAKRSRGTKRNVPAPAPGGMASAAAPAPGPPLSATPVPVPSVPAAPAPVPAAPAPADGNNTASTDDARLRALIRDYLRSIEDNDPSGQDRFFADQVNFYGQGSLERSQVQDSTHRYHEQWPVRKWTADGKPRIFGPTGSSMYQVLQPFRWMISNGFQSYKGEATLQMLVEKDASGEFRIVAVRQLNR
jgi:hypothetical protein